MPRVPFVESTVGISPTPLSNGPGVALGAGLQNLGQTLGQVADVQARAEEQRRRETDERVEREKHQQRIRDASTAATNLRAHFTTRFAELQDQADEGATNFTQNLEKEFDGYQKGVLDNLTDPDTRFAVEQDSLQYRTALTADALRFEHGRRVDKRQRDIGANVNTAGNTVFQDYRQLGDSLRITLGAIDASDLPADVKAVARADAEHDLTASGLAGLIERDPAAAKREIAKYGAVLAPADALRLTNAADAELKRRQAEAERRQALNEARSRGIRLDNLASLETTGKEIPGADARTLGLSPEDAADYEQQQATATQAYGVKTGLSTATPERAASIIEALKPEAGVEGFAAKQKLYEFALDRYDDRNKALVADPAAYVTTTDSVVRETVEAAAADPENTAKREAAIFASQNAQERLGLPPQARRVLTTQEALTLASQIQSLPPEQRAGAILALDATYGPEYSPRVFGELVEAGLPGETQVLALLDRPQDAFVRTAFAEALGVGDKALKQNLADGAVGDVDDAVALGLQPFRVSVAYAGEAGIGPYNTIAGAAKSLAYYYIGQGVEPTEAAERAVAELITSRYEFDPKDGYRVPDGTDLTDVGVATLERLRRLTAESLVPYGSAADPDLPETNRQKVYLESTLTRGHWATNSDESGLLLLDEFNRPVRLAGGGQVELLFRNVKRNVTGIDIVGGANF